MRAAFVLLFAAPAASHDRLPINPELGVGGYPHCVQTVAKDKLSTDPEVNEFTLNCSQVPRDTDDQITIGCVGDSITAGVHSSGRGHTYPDQLQTMLDASYPNKYKVTNMGACGSTMQKCADSPFWKRPQYKTLTGAKWDIIIIMLGTNDAKDKGSGHGQGSCGPDGNWAHNCTGAGATTCPFAKDYSAMIDLVRTLGTPKIYLAVPPPLMQQGAYGMNQTVINDVFPPLIRSIASHNKIPSSNIIDVYKALGGEANWRQDYPKSCAKTTTKPTSCALFCDDQSCDQCHPDDNGYIQMAKTMKAGLGL